MVSKRAFLVVLLVAVGLMLPSNANYLDTGVVVMGITDEVVDQFLAYQVASNSSEILQWFARYVHLAFS